MPTNTRKKINLALQGGGAHGAFTWGILDLFLESKLFTIEGISATSAGSLNAIILTQGLMNGGEQGARDLLREFWRLMSEAGKTCGTGVPCIWAPFLDTYSKSLINFYFLNAISNVLSPYQFNPSNTHPIGQVLEKIIDIETLKNQKEIKLFLCATNVETGKIRIFNADELSINAILASACLPKLFQAVQVDGEHYWDGGYLGNPAIFPIIYNCESADIVIMHTVPIARKHIPSTVAEIDSRIREISFNSSLMREMRAIAFVTRMKEEGWLKEEYESRLRKIHVHCIRADKCLKKYPLPTVYTPDWDFLMTLFELGRQEGEQWINKHYDSIGKKTTIDFDEWL